MNNLINRDYHEAIGSVIPVQLNKELQLGNSLLSKIPHNAVEDAKNMAIEKTENPNKMTLDEIKKLIPKLNYNLPEEKEETKLMERIFIDTHNYWGLYEIYINKYPYNLVNPFVIYTYCRNLCGKPMTKNEYTKITMDLKSIKKSIKHIEQKDIKYKKKAGSYKVDFK